jgi:hypothetical protein
VRRVKLDEALKQLDRLLHERGPLNLEEAFVDATFASAKKGASPLVYPSRQGHENHCYRR